MLGVWVFYKSIDYEVTLDHQAQVRKNITDQRNSLRHLMTLLGKGVSKSQIIQILEDEKIIIYFEKGDNIILEGGVELIFKDSKLFDIGISN